MNIKNLIPKEKIKNYKELCNLLEIKPTTGNAKKAQLKQLERYCKYRKEKTSFIIDEIYKYPLPEIENLKNNKYSVHIEKLIIHMLSLCPINKDTKTINMSRNGLYLMLHMINNNYTIGRNNINSFSRYLNVPTATVYDFYNNTSNKMNSTVERTLNKLQRQCLIKWEYRTAIKSSETDTIRLATDNEINIIIEAERLTLKELKCEDKQEVFLKGKWNDFNSEVIKKVKDHNILYYFKTFYIYTTKDFREMLLNEYEVMECQGELSSQLYYSAIETADKHHKKLKDKYVDYLPPYESEKVGILEEYPSHIKKIADITISEFCEELLLNLDDRDVYTFNEYMVDKFNAIQESKELKKGLINNELPF